MEIKITSKEQFKENLGAERVVVDFNAQGAGPCRMLAPVLSEIAGQDSSLVVLKVDTDEFPDLAMEYNVSAIPAVFYLKNGKVVGSSVGFLPKPQLEKEIKKNLG